MRKSNFFIVGALLSFAFAAGGYETVTASAQEQGVYVGGMSAGFTLKSGNPQIIGISEVLTEKGACSPAATAGLRAGDKIYKAGGIRVETIKQLNEIVNKTQEKALELQVLRGNEEILIKVTPAKDRTTGHYKIGILARDSISGIGTVTYIDKANDRFGALGHAVSGENKRELSITDGLVYECSIVGVNKGIRGKAGELRGMFLNNKTIGVADKLCDCGIFGKVDKNFQTDGLIYTVADSQSVVPGNAVIYSTVNGVTPVKYDIEIVKVDKNNKENKNFVIKITDEELIRETGGIVQGMSGSPIMQNGKLIGAVTHVFVNDPTRGYGIDIQTMLKE
jgi:stage IV sporulation protein B